MQLSVSSGKFGILQRATFLTFGDSLDHTTSYPLADMVASANEWVAKVATWAWQASGTWEFDDANQTTLPSGTTSLVNAQADYTLPTTALQLQGVEVKDSGGNWQRLTEIDKSELTEITDFEKTAGMPKYYDVVGNSLVLYPAPATASVTTASGLKIHVAREATTFSVPASYTTADTTQPGFDESFHDIVCYGIASDYLEGNDSEKAEKYFQKIQLMRLDLNKHYGMKNKDKKIAFKPRIENYK